MKKKFLACLLIALSVTCLPVSASSTTTKYASSISKIELSDRNLYTTDIIEYKYRISSTGKLQYRRWNASRKKWVDPYWIDVK